MRISDWSSDVCSSDLYEANLAMYNCDVMINIGARFDDRVTGRLDEFSPRSKKIHVDIDASSINKNVMVDMPIVGDAGAVLEDLLAAWQARKLQLDQKAVKAWWQKIEEWRARDFLKLDTRGEVIKPQHNDNRRSALQPAARPGGK